MKVSSTELQNNFGKYLLLCIGEPVIISKNGREIAKLTSLEATDEYDSEKSIINEEAFSYGFGIKKASYKEFQELTRDNEERYEYIDGEIYYLASPKTTHQIVLTELFVIFHHWFQEKKCTPMVAPYDITLKRHPEDINIVQPDIMVICDLDEKLNQQDYYMGTPALVVEIISESTKRKDLIKKLDLYMSCGIQEYWIVNPSNRQVSIYLFKDQNIREYTAFKYGETAESFTFKGLTVNLSQIFR